MRRTLVHSSVVRRVLTLTLVFLLLGLALNILIAWSCAVLSSPDPMNSGLDPLLLAPLRREFFDRRGPDPGGSDPGTLFVTVAHACFGAQFLDVKVEDDDIPTDWMNGPLPYIAYVRSGWPVLSLEAEWHRDASRSPAPQPARTRWGLSLNATYVSGNRLFMPRTLPLRPMWPGFAIGSLTWTAIAACTWLTITGLIRLRRRLRGCCTHCGYPIGVSDVCSECGRFVRRRASPISEPR